MTAILGISAFYHDSAAVLIVDGKIVAAAQEERFTRTKHDASFPACAIEYCLREAGITASDLDYVGFYEKPLLKFDRLIETSLSFAPFGFRAFASAMPDWLLKKLQLRRVIRRGLGKQYRRRIVFCRHHQSHAASAFFPSPFDRAAILTCDGVGEWSTTTLGTGESNQIKLDRELRFPNSLGLLYSAFTYYCGFRVNSGEYKLMGLAPYGSPKYADLIKQRLVKIFADGSFTLDMDYFGFCNTLRMTTTKFHRLFGRPPRQADAEIETLDQDLAASIQCVTEEILLKTAEYLYQTTKRRNLCIAGGVALNCVANGRILREGPFDRIWIQPAAGDAGGAFGVAQLIWYQLLQNERQLCVDDPQHSTLLGPSYSAADVRSSLERLGAEYRRIEDPAVLNRQVAALLAAGKVVGRFAGRAEFGPRALGNRSILGDPRRPEMQSTMNQKIKFRESFRPFAPAVLAERAAEYFDVDGMPDSRFMLLVCDVTTGELPAVTHVNRTARIQTVSAYDNAEFESLLREFDRQTGCPVLINTSFNVRGEPIVGSPEDAYRCFCRTEMDAVVIEDCLLTKQPSPWNVN